MEQLEFLQRVVDVFDKLGLEYAVVGSYAVIAYGHSRFTNDIDVVVNLPDVKVAAFCREFPPPDWYVSEPAAHEAVFRRRPFNVIHPASGHKLDVMIPKQTTWARSQLARRRPVELLPGRDVYAAHPEDVILGKLLYFQEGASDKHLTDIAGILQVSGADVDRESVWRWAEELGVADIWQTIIDRIDQADAGGESDVPF